MKKGIVVPFDGSANAIEAVRAAIDLAKAFGENIILLNVQPSFKTVHTKMFFSNAQIQEYQNDLYQEVIKSAVVILKEAGVEFTTKLRVGDAKAQIILEASGSSVDAEACSEDGARFIVMGSRGMNAVLGSVLGSVSYGVLHQAVCPVVIVPHSC